MTISSSSTVQDVVAHPTAFASRYGAPVITHVDTDMFRRAAAIEPRKAEFAAAMHPVGRIGRAEEIAAAVMYLCGENSGFTTGIALPVDGGSTCI